MRIAVYGGSFNPPHVGHAMVASWVKWTDQADEVWLVPAFSHAFSKKMASFEARVRMSAAMARSLGSWARVLEIERELPVPSYTIDTLLALKERYPEHSFRLLIGSDTLDDTHRWERWSQIDASFPPIVAGREGYQALAGVPMFPGVSSTEVRARLTDGESVTGLLASSVLAIARGVYGNNRG